MSYKVEVCVERAWSSNAIRFGTIEEADDYGKDLLSRWYVPSDYRVVGTNDEVNYVFKDGQARSLKIEKGE